MKNTLLRILLIFGIGVGSALACFIAPQLLLVAAAAIGFIGIAWGIGYGTGALLLSVAGIAAVSWNDPWYMGSLVGMTVIGSIILMLGFRRRAPYRMLAIALAVTALAGLYVQTCLPSILEGREPYAYVSDMYLELDKLYTELGIDMGINDVLAELPTVFYGYILALAELYAFLTLVICRRFCTWGKCDVRPMAKFDRWELPKSLRLGLLILTLTCFIMYIAGYRGADTIVASLTGMFAPVFGVYGLSFLVFTAKRRAKMGRSMLWFYVLLPVMFLMLPLMVVIPMLLVFLGIAELFFGMRRSAIECDEIIRKARERAIRENRNTIEVDLGRRGRFILDIRKGIKKDRFFDDDRFDDSASDPFGERSRGYGRNADKHDDTGASDNSSEPNDDSNNANGTNKNHDNAGACGGEDDDKGQKDCK